MMQKEVLRRLPCVKGVMKGEGEKTFKEICRIYRNEFEKRENVCGYQDKNVDNSWKKSESVDNQLKGVDGITFREEKEKIIDNPWRPIMDLSEVPFVYDHMEDFGTQDYLLRDKQRMPVLLQLLSVIGGQASAFQGYRTGEEGAAVFPDHKSTAGEIC